MIKAVYNNKILELILSIEKKKINFEEIEIPHTYVNKMRKNSKKMSSFASNKIEGNPLSLSEANKAIESKNRHFLKPEQEIRNYYNALNYLEECAKKDVKINEKLILNVQKRVIEGSSQEKIGFRGAMPPGVLFAVYDSKTKKAEYIPPAYEDIKELIDELIDYINNSSDHPLIKAAILHYQILTIHPFEDGNGRTARLISDYYLDINGYSFSNLGSLEEYFYYNLEEYYESIQMGLPPLYYDGRNEPPHPEIWFEYYLRMINLYTSKILEISKEGSLIWFENGFKELKVKEKDFFKHLLDNEIRSFSPKSISSSFNLSNKTIINWCVNLVKVGFLKPNLINKRITSYELTPLINRNKKEIIKFINEN